MNVSVHIIMHVQAVACACKLMWRVHQQVARFTWKGVEKGQYVIGSPDSGGNMLIGSSLAANSARYYPAWMEFLLAPLFVLVHALIRRAVEASTKKILTATELQLPVSSANGGGKSSKDE